MQRQISLHKMHNLCFVFKFRSVCITESIPNVPEVHACTTTLTNITSTSTSLKTEGNLED